MYPFIRLKTGQAMMLMIKGEILPDQNCKGWNLNCKGQMYAAGSGFVEKDPHLCSDS
jgi:hypothetical protein